MHSSYSLDLPSSDFYVFLYLANNFVDKNVVSREAYENRTEIECISRLPIEGGLL